MSSDFGMRLIAEAIQGGLSELARSIDGHADAVEKASQRQERAMSDLTRAVEDTKYGVQGGGPR